jgi:long-chain acyl-CoA synthetase
MAAAGGRKQKLFNRALQAKAEGLKYGRMKHHFYDTLIFNKLKRGLGMDCLRFMGSGSAPLSEHVMIFFRSVLGIPVVEGYGQTEGAGAATVSHMDDLATQGHVGGPTGMAEIVLVDVPEMGYFHTDREHRGQPCRGRGEICMRGPSVFQGYYKDPQKTRETIDEEGWLHSGDIGLWRPDGNLQIIDRKKNIFKLSQGEYVAPEKIENILINSSLIGQCFVYGDSLQSTLVGLVVPDEQPVRLWAQKHAPELAQAPWQELCQSPALKAAILKEIDRLSKDAQLHGFEIVRSIAIIPDLFSVDNELLTPTFKMKRQQIRDRYLAELQRLYNEQPAPRSKL